MSHKLNASLQMEDGQPNYLRTDFINYFIKIFDYKSYLEIGVKHPNKNFNKINCEDKIGVDILPGTTYKMTSDEFFETQAKDTKWDIIFIDGDHSGSQVKKDILNSLNHLNENGTIFCHDVSPEEEWMLGKQWCFTAWEAFAELRCEREDLEMYTLPFDHSGFIRFGHQELFKGPIEKNWNFLNENRQTLMNLLTIEEFTEKYK